MQLGNLRGARWASLGGLVLIGCAATRAEAPPAASLAPLPAVEMEEAPIEVPAAPVKAARITLPCAVGDVVGCTQGCDDGAREDCVSLALTLLDGAVVSVDPLRAASLLREACEGSSARGCLRLGELYDSGDPYGRGPKMDTAEAARLYGIACEGNNNLGCYHAALAHLEGRGVAIDAVYAGRLLGRVCTRGHADSCLQLGRLYVRGDGVSPDEDRASELFAKACALGSSEACQRLP